MKGIELLKKFCDECVEQLHFANQTGQTDYAREIVFIEHKLQLMKGKIRKEML